MSISTFFNRLNPTQVAKTLGVTIGTLAVWRCTKRYKLPFLVLDPVKKGQRNPSNGY